MEGAPGPTFVLTDIEGSTLLWERAPAAMAGALERHHALLVQAFESHGGRVVKERGEGDSMFAVFDDPAAAVASVVAVQAALDREPWPTEIPLRVRLGIHTGPATTRADDWYGPAVDRCGRLRSAAHGGQAILSRTTAGLVSERLPEGVVLRSLGRHRLHGIAAPEEVFQICPPGLRCEFPPLRSLDTAPHDLPVAPVPRARVTPPLPVGEQIVRRRALLAEAMSRRLTTVVAGPGFGKSTALGDWASTVPCAWYTLDAGDAAPTRLAAGIVEALNVRLADFAADFGVVPASLESDPDWLEGFAATLCTALDLAIVDDLALVLDDFHVLGEGAPGLAVVEAMVRLAPPGLHIVIGSRTDPPFPVERLRGQGQVLSVHAGDLAFDAADVQRLLVEVLGDQAAGLTAELMRVTSGWPAAVRLAVETLRRRPAAERPAALQGAGSPGGALYAYLAEEVLRHEPPQTRMLIERTAALGAFTVELCEVLGVSDAAGILEGLSRRGVFLEPGSGADGWFALHALIRGVAGARRKDDAEWRRWQGVAARWFEEHGHLEQAMSAYASTGQLARVRGLVIEHGHSFVASGQGPAVVEIVRTLPPGDPDPSFDERMGELLAASGESEAAAASLSRAALGVDPLPSGLAFRYAMAVHYTLGRVRDALEVWERARPRAPATHEDAMLLAFLANAEAQVALAERACETAATGLAVAKGLASRTPEAECRIALGMAAAAMGDHEAALDHYRRGRLAAEHDGNMIAVSRARVFSARSLIDRGDLQKAASELATVLPLTERIGWWLFRAWGLCERARVRTCTGDLQAALADCAEALAVLGARGSEFACRPLILRGDVHRQRGDAAHAAAAYEEALPLAERSGVVAEVAGALSGLARVGSREGHDVAARWAERAIAATSGEGLAGSVLAAGWLALAAGDAEGAAARADEGRAIALARGEQLMSAEAEELAALAERPVTPERLERHAPRWEELGDVVSAERVRLAAARLRGIEGEPAARRSESRLRALGVNVDGLRQVAGALAIVPAADMAPVVIETLGGFAVLRDGIAVGSEDWRNSRKARDLLRLLIARRGRPASRDLLAEALWPGEPADKLANRLSVALAAVRHVLDPDRLSPADHFVRVDGGSVSIDLSVIPVDVERFLSLAGSGLRLRQTGAQADATELLDLAEQAYSGDFLEDCYDDWAVPLRDEARGAYLAVAHALAADAAQAGEADRAVRYLLRLLERDPYDEAAHLELVGILSSGGRHGEARRRHLVYARRMGEIGVEPVTFGSAPERDADPAAV